MIASDGTIRKFALQRHGDPGSWSGMLWPSVEEAEAIRASKDNPSEWEIVSVTVFDPTDPA